MQVKKSRATGDRLHEARSINLSLSALGKCIHALTEAKMNFVPFRESKLTRLLQDSLGGNCKTSLIVTIGPSAKHIDETISSLIFGQRAMKVENKPIINKQKDYYALSLQLQNELDGKDDQIHKLEISQIKLLDLISQLKTVKFSKKLLIVLKDMEDINLKHASFGLHTSQRKQQNLSQMSQKTVDSWEVQKKSEIEYIESKYKQLLSNMEQEHKNFLEEIDGVMLEHENEIELLRSENEQLKAKQDQQDNELQEIKDELDNEKKDNQFKMNETLSNKFSELDELKSSNECLRSELSEMKQQNNKLQYECKNKDQEIKEKEDELTKLYEENTQMLQEYQNFEKIKQELIYESDALKEKQEKTQELLSEQLFQRNQKIRALEEEIKKFEEQAIQFQSEKQSIQESKQDAQLYAQLSHQNEELTIQNYEFTEQIEINKNQITEQQNEITKLLDEKAKLDEQFQKYQLEFKQLNTDYSILSDTLSISNQQQEILKEKNSELIGQFSKMSEDYQLQESSWQQQIQEILALTEQLQQQKAILEEQVFDYSQELSKQNQEKLILEQCNYQLEAQSQELQIILDKQTNEQLAQNEAFSKMEQQRYAFAQEKIALIKKIKDQQEFISKLTENYKDFKQEFEELNHKSLQLNDTHQINVGLIKEAKQNFKLQYQELLEQYQFFQQQLSVKKLSIENIMGLQIEKEKEKQSQSLQLKQEAKLLKDQNVSIQKEYKEKCELIEIIQRKLKVQCQVQEELQQKYDVCQSIIQQNKQQFEQLLQIESNYLKLQNEMKEVKQNNIILQEQYQEQCVVNDQLQNTMKNQSHNLISQNDQLLQNEEEIKLKDQTLLNLESKLQSQQNQIEELNQLQIQQNSQKELSEKIINQKQQKIKELIDNISQITQNNENYALQLEKLQKQEECNQGLLSEYENQNNQVVKQLEDLQNQQYLYTQQINQLNSVIEQQQQNFEKEIEEYVQCQTNQQNNNYEQIQNLNEQIQSQQQQQVNQQIEYEQQLLDLNREIKDLEEEIGELNENLDIMNEQQFELNIQKSDLTNENQEIKKQRSQLFRIIQKYQKSLIYIEQQISNIEQVSIVSINSDNLKIYQSIQHFLKCFFKFQQQTNHMMQFNNSLLKCNYESLNIVKHQNCLQQTLEGKIIIIELQDQQIQQLSQLNQQLKQETQEVYTRQNIILQQIENINEHSNQQINYQIFIQEFQIKSENAQALLCKLQNQVQEDKEFKENLDSQLRNLEDQIQSQKDKHTNEILLQQQGFKNKIIELQDQNVQLYKNCEILKTDNSQIQEKIKTLGEKLDKKQKKCKQNKVIIQNLQNQMKQLESEIAKYLDQIVEQEKFIKSIKDNYTQQLKESQQSNLNNTDYYETSLRELKAVWSQEIDKYKNEKSEIEKQYQELAQKHLSFDESNSTLEEWSPEVDFQIKANQKLQDKVHELTQLLASNQQYEKQKDNFIQFLELEINSKEEQVNQMNKILNQEVCTLVIDNMILQIENNQSYPNTENNTNLSFNNISDISVDQQKINQMF